MITILILAILIFIIKLYGAIGVIVCARDAWREIYTMHSSRLDPYGTTNFQAWKTSLHSVHWLVLPIYLLFYLIFWPCVVFNTRRKK
jgi:hypothetical protein